MARNGSLKPKQIALLEALLSGEKLTEAIKKLGVPLRTASNWIADPIFDQEYQAAKRSIMDHSLTRLHQKFDDAVDKLGKELDADEARDRIKASEVIVSKTIQTLQLKQRIEELEKQLEALKQEQEQSQMYKVAFDLRNLTREERSLLESIEDRINGTGKQE